MEIGVMGQAVLMGEFGGEVYGRGYEEEEGEVEEGGMGGEEGSAGDGEMGVSGRGNGGAIRDRPVKVIPCPRCQSMNTKFCYYNNYSVNQPRHFCRNCQRYWTVGGTLRNVPVGGGSRKKTRTRSRNDAYLVRGSVGESLSLPAMSTSTSNTTAMSSPGLLSASSCMQQLSMLPSTLGGMGFAPFPATSSSLPFLGSFGASTLLPTQMLPESSPVSGLQEVPDLQTLYDTVPPVPQLVNSAPMVMPDAGFFLPEFQSMNCPAPCNDTLASVMAKASLWSSAPAQQLQALTGGRAPPAWDAKPTNSLTSHQLRSLSGYEPIGSTPMNSKLASLQGGFWDTPALLPNRPLMNDRLVPHVASHNSWDDGLNSTSISPNSSTTDEERCPPSNCFGYHEDVISSQPWVGLQASDILQF